jgi:hypothetical protein
MQQVLPLNLKAKRYANTIAQSLMSPQSFPNCVKLKLVRSESYSVLTFNA